MYQGHRKVFLRKHGKQPIDSEITPIMGSLSKTRPHLDSFSGSRSPDSEAGEGHGGGHGGSHHGWAVSSDGSTWAQGRLEGWTAGALAVLIVMNIWGCSAVHH